MLRLEAPNLRFAPRPISRRLDLLALDAERRIFRDAAFADGPLQTDAHRVQKIALREWRRDLLVDEALHMLALEQHDAFARARVDAVERLVAVRSGEVFEDVAARALRLGGKPLER